MCCDPEKTQAPDTSRVDKLYNVFADQAEIGRADRLRTSAEILAELFSYHPPTELTLPKFAAINQAAKNFAEVVLQNCPKGSDRKRAIDLIRDARMVANAAVALDGLSL